MSKDNIYDKVHVIFGFDMETDIGSFTPYYEGLKNATPKLLDIFQEKDIKGTFFYTGDAAKKNPENVRSVVNSGNEVGCHSLFHETVGNPLFPIPSETALLPEEVPLRIKKATEWVEEVAGHRPVSFRSPRLWGSTAVVNTLNELGYLVDASYPMYYYQKRLTAYYPSSDDWTEPGNLQLLEIPNFADLTMESEDPGLERDRDQWPLFRTKGSNFLMQKINHHIKLLKEKNLPIVLCFYFHPWEFISLQKSYHFGEARVTPDDFLTEGSGEKAIEEFSKLIDELKSIGAEFYRADDFAKYWREELNG
ncbi:MAG TPA: polysaccharide deacetylase family protein [Candidatus Avamphibacillus sp.]|nr:polysaccharide deacetylase family protein [Candidatus Avamphibacillus sp.]